MRLQNGGKTYWAVSLSSIMISIGSFSWYSDDDDGDDDDDDDSINRGWPGMWSLWYLGKHKFNPPHYFHSTWWWWWSFQCLLWQSSMQCIYLHCPLHWLIISDDWPWLGNIWGYSVLTQCRALAGRRKVKTWWKIKHYSIEK